MAPTTAPYGSWKSPITSDLIVASTIRLGEVRLDGDDLYWLEGRPAEAGRYVVVRQQGNGQPEDVTPPGFNVRTRVHEYGGGSYIVVDGTVYFSNFSDQRLYRQAIGSAPEPITAADTGYRYADAVMDPLRQRLICVREDHSGEGEAVNTIVAVALDGTQQILVSGQNFYSSPRISPDGTKLCWLSWNHPDMPWDGTELWCAAISEAGLTDRQRIAGGRSEAVVQPEWSPDGQLYFVSDRSDWWNLYCWRDEAVAAVCPRTAEFGLPHWVFRMSTYRFAEADRIICAYIEDGETQLAELIPSTGTLKPIEIPFTSLGSLQVGSSSVAFIGASPTSVSAVVKVPLGPQQVQILQRSSQTTVDPGYLSVPTAIAFPTTNGNRAYGFYYPPRNQDFEAPPQERPPLLVKIHGGPTAATSTALDLRIQYWTSRGIAILDVNYGGSTGYGRRYRDRLKGNWGIVDVDDCVNGAQFLVNDGKADGDRLMIDGGSAGGYTTLAALAFRDTFKAGASLYGVSDAEALAQDTHKFESRYLDSLIGPYPAEKARYVERSPIHAADRLCCPVIFLQGDEDKIVPPNQAEMMVSALKEKGVPVAYVLFAGEQHGFRKAENIKRALDAELYFYAQVFGFELADAVEPVEIHNLG